MLQTICKIVFEQVTPYNGQVRNSTFSVNFTNEIEIKSSWSFMTDSCTIKIPRKLYFTDSKGFNFSLDDRDVYANETNVVPVFMRGDKVSVYLGYIYPSTTNAGFNKELNLEFDGYITKVNPRTPIELYCEDAMWLLKQIHAPNKSYSGNAYDCGKIIKEMVGNKLPSDFIIRDSAQTKFGGEFITSNQTVAQALQALKKDAYIYPYVRRITNKDGTYRHEIRVSSVVYYPEDLRDIVGNSYDNGGSLTPEVLNKERFRNWIFEFQNNIISDELVYSRKDDVNIRVEAKSYYEVVEGGKKKLKQITTTLPENAPSDSEKRQLVVYGLNTIEKLKSFAQLNLNRVIYEGYKGSITVFGIPSVRHGDLITIIDKKFPERNGAYLCKQVEKRFGINGFRQEITLDMKVYNLDTSGNYVPLDLITDTYARKGGL